MIALLLTLLTFLAFWFIGLGVQTAVRAETSSLRIALAAPALGTAATVLPLFVLSRAGVSMNDVARPVLLTLVAGSAVVIGLRRPRLPWPLAAMLALCSFGLVLVGWPMFGLGFDWIANANDDMANYVLSATKLMNDGLLGPLDVERLSADRNYASALQVLHSAGARPGADITLAGYSAALGRPPYELFMPFILTLSLVAACSAAALALQASRRWWAALVAATLLLVSPLATYGVVQQLLPQVWGLGLAAALLALLMRSELHRAPGASARDVVPIGLLTAAAAVVYIELTSTLVLSYALYVAVLAARRELALRFALRLWAPVLLIVLVALNSYVLREVDFVRGQASTGLSSTGDVPIFGYTLVPAALPAIVGLEPFAGAASAHLSASILVAALLLGVVVVASIFSASRGVAAAIVLVTYVVLAAVLVVNSADFGLFKLYMYAQPFLAAAAAVWVSWPARKPLVWGAAGVVALLVLFQAQTQQLYVEGSRSPVDLRHASDADLLPAFRRFVAESRGPVVSVTEHPTLAKIEAASMGRRPLLFTTFNPLSYFSSEDPDLQRQLAVLAARDGWKDRSFDLHALGSIRQVDRFADNAHASELLSAGDCLITFLGGTQLALNRRSFPEGSPSLVGRECPDLRNVLAYTVSARGSGYYLSRAPNSVSFYQLEPDPFRPGRTFAGSGRFILFRVLGSTARVRLVLDFTATFRPETGSTLPPAAAVGAERVTFPVVGRGSARVVSPVLRPQLIHGQPYILVDMGRDGRLPHAKRWGLAGLWGDSVALDPRYLTSHIRDVSLVTDGEYRRFAAPSVIQDFPADLADPDLEYSGIYEDGSIGEESEVVLAPGGPTTLVMRADIAAPSPRRLRVTVGGRPVISRRVSPGPLRVRVRLPTSKERRRIALSWETLAPPAGSRPAVARLELIGLVPPARG